MRAILTFLLILTAAPCFSAAAMFGLTTFAGMVSAACFIVIMLNIALVQGA